MDRQELIDNLGTIARSGTRAFMSRLAEAKDGTGLIGQFGVGFYSAFMVADRIEVTSRRAGAGEAWVWRSSGGAGFEVVAASEEQAARVPRGTEVVLHLKDDAKQYLEPHEIERIVRTYSDHILFPIELADGKDDPRQINAASAIWQRSKSELEAGGLHAGLPHDRRRFRRAGHDAALQGRGPPGLRRAAVCALEPAVRPVRSRRARAASSSTCAASTSRDDADLLPPYLRFVRGVDRQRGPAAQHLARDAAEQSRRWPRSARPSRAASSRELETLAGKDAERFGKVWEAFGSVIKEGIYEDFERRDQLLALARFATTKDGGAALAQASTWRT